MIIVQIAGRLGRKPESRFTPSGQKVTTFSVATNVRKAGKDEAVWWRVSVWGDRHDKMIAYLDKGSAVIVVGEMNKPEIWTDKDGRQQVTLEINADIIKFSPFGNPDRPAQEQGGATQSAPQSQGQGNNRDHFNEDNGGSGYSAPAQSQGQAAYSSPSGYGTNPAASSYSHSAQADDPLPF
ncbi:MAG: single-stranded DNA-binding protein [Parachlamydiaceae bacterium]